MQTFSLIELHDIETTPEGLEIKIASRIKTARPNSLNPVLYLPFFRDQPAVCAASTLVEYISRTETNQL